MTIRKAKMNGKLICEKKGRKRKNINSFEMQKKIEVNNNNFPFCINN